MTPNEQSAAAPAVEAPPEEEVVQPISAADLEVEKPEKAQTSLLDQIVNQMDSDQRAKLVELELESREFFHNQRVGKMFAASGYFKDVRNVAQAATKIEMGRSWKMDVANSMRYIYWINQRPAVMEEYMQAELTRKGWGFVPHFPGGTGRNCKGCHIAILFKGEPFMVPVVTDDGRIKLDDAGLVVKQPLVVSFTEDDASVVTIWENKQRIPLLKKKGPWSDGFRADMYFNRALSRFRRRYDADVLSGALTRDEASDMQEEDDILEPIAQPAVIAAASAALKDAKPKADPKPKPKDEAPAAAMDPNWMSNTFDKSGHTGPTSDKMAPLPQTLKAISKMEALLGTKLWLTILNGSGFASPDAIQTETEAAAVLAAMDKAKQEGSKK